MRFKVVDLKALHGVGGVAGTLIKVETDPWVSLTERQVGFIVPKHRFNTVGVVSLGGIVQPGWDGNIIVTMLLREELCIPAREKVAHLVVFTEAGG